MCSNQKHLVNDPKKCLYANEIVKYSVDSFNFLVLLAYMVRTKISALSSLIVFEICFFSLFLTYFYFTLLFSQIDSIKPNQTFSSSIISRCSKIMYFWTINTN